MTGQGRVRELVEPLFFMTPAQLEFMETRREVILSARSDLESFKTPSLTDDGSLILRELTVRLTGLHDVCAFFDATTVQGLRDEYATTIVMSAKVFPSRNMAKTYNSLKSRS